MGRLIVLGSKNKEIPIPAGTLTISELNWLKSINSVLSHGF